VILIPSLDLRAGRCVRLKRGRFDEVTWYELEPGAVLAGYRALGARWAHVVDLDGAQAGGSGQRELVGRLAASAGLALQVGGGIRDAAAIDAWCANGVGRVVLGTLALADPEATRAALKRHGGQRIVLALDVRIRADGTPLVATHGWARDSSRSLWEVIADYLPHGLAHVLCTDVERDGMLAGPNLALYHEAARRFPTLAWQASGGVRDAADLAALAEAGVAAAISGRAMLEGRLSAEELRPYLPSA
jgi:phosphoribosylformimino-5-aminoimidazole carboxamide ribotide isomerase